VAIRSATGSTLQPSPAFSVPEMIRVCAIPDQPSSACSVPEMITASAIPGRPSPACPVLETIARKWGNGTERLSGSSLQSLATEADTEFGQGFVFDLADAFAGQAETLADFFERFGFFAVEAEAHA